MAGKDKYWEKYTNLQRVKHALIREYLNGWFPKLGFWSGRILYLDTYAGAGEHTKGEKGSPVVALSTFLGHKSRDAILENSEVIFHFFEIDQRNVEALKKVVEQSGELPRRVMVRIHEADCENVLEALLDGLDKDGKRMAPAFAFVDPFGFKIQYGLLARLMKYEHVEVFVNVIWYELGIATRSAPKGKGKVGRETLDYIFGGEQWCERITAEPDEERLRQTLAFIKDILGARWMTSVEMLNEKNRPQHVLAYFTNHPDGRDLMKSAMWKHCRAVNAGFVARKAEPGLELFPGEAPDLSDLTKLVVAALQGGPLRWSDLSDVVGDTPVWMDRHLRSVLIALRNEKRIECGGGHLGPKHNQLIRLK